MYHIWFGSLFDMMVQGTYISSLSLSNTKCMKRLASTVKKAFSTSFPLLGWVLRQYFISRCSVYVFILSCTDLVFWRLRASLPCLTLYLSSNSLYFFHWPLPSLSLILFIPQWPLPLNHIPQGISSLFSSTPLSLVLFTTIPVNYTLHCFRISLSLLICTFEFPSSNSLSYSLFPYHSHTLYHPPQSVLYCLPASLFCSINVTQWFTSTIPLTVCIPFSLSLNLYPLCCHNKDAARRSIFSLPPLLIVSRYFLPSMFPSTMFLCFPPHVFSLVPVPTFKPLTVRLKKHWTHSFSQLSLYHSLYP